LELPERTYTGKPGFSALANNQAPLVILTIQLLLAPSYTFQICLFAR
jgi:hypothetical protein